MTEGFLSSIEAQAKSETERIVNELKALKLDANQVITVLNALKLEVPKELRELAPIEVVPRPPMPAEVEKVDMVTGDITFHKERSRKGGLAGSKANQKKAEEKYQACRSELMVRLSKGPVLTKDLVKQLKPPYSEYTITQALRRMKKAGEVDTRTVGFQGPTEWFLPSRPVTLEKVRDTALKVRESDGKVMSGRVANELNITPIHAHGLMTELVAQGILNIVGANFYYHKPKIKAIPASRRERHKDFGGSAINGTGGDKISSDKVVREMCTKAKAQGAIVHKTSEHISVKFMGKTIIIGKTPSESGIKQDREKLKKMGLRV